LVIALLVSTFVTTFAGCVDQRVPRLVQQARLQEDLIIGAEFRHRVYRNQASLAAATAIAHMDREPAVLHIYIEGDGRPFLEPTTVAADPTPRDPLMLRLMSLDPAPSVYLGRPCYFGLSHDRNCNASYWTLRRFSPEVVASLAAAAIAEIGRSKAHQVELYGHSGGAALAMLLAAQLPSVTRVVTIGANLDTAAWCSLHGYTPLLGSLNPVEQPVPPGGIRLLHLVGSKDTNTPPGLVASAAAHMGASESVRVIQGYTHNCCWQEVWRGVLEDDSSAR
jgi:pimeloyl-ACP methyl ester carboxylesterase